MGNAVADATSDNLIVDSLAKAKLQLLTDFLGRHLAYQVNDGRGIALNKGITLLANCARKMVADGKKCLLDLILFGLILQLTLQLGHNELA